MNKHRRNRHLAIRNIQRTSWLGTLTYREARRKHKAGYRAVPVGKGYFTRWFLLNFGSDRLTLAQTRKLGEEYTLISEHAESAGFKATMSYRIKVRWLRFKYQGPNNVWAVRISFEQATQLIDCGSLAEHVKKAAECDLSDSYQSNNIGVQRPFSGISHYTCSEDFNEIVSHSVRDRVQGIGSLAYRSVPLLVFAGYGVAKADK